MDASSSLADDRHDDGDCRGAGVCDLDLQAQLALEAEVKRTQAQAALARLNYHEPDQRFSPCWPT